MLNYRCIIALLFVVLVTFTAFYPSLKNGFTNWDDPILVTENARITSLSPGNIREIFTSFHYRLYHPLVLLSYAFEYRWFRLDPAAYHATNLLLHLLNCLLVFWLFYLLTQKGEVAFAVALLFGVHPLHVESVAWVSQRKDVLCAFFYLGALIGYWQYLEGRGRKHYYLSLVLFAASLLAKPVSATFPFVLLLVDYFRGRTFRTGVLLEKIPFALPALLLAGLTMLRYYEPGTGQVIPSGQIAGNLAAIPHHLWFYISKTVLPLKLSCLYPSPVESSSPLFPRLAFPALATAAGTAAVVFSFRYTKKIVFGALFFFLAALPTLHFGLAADRYSYIPSLGLLYLLAEGGAAWYRRGPAGNKVLAIAVFSGMIAAFSLLTWNRCRVWKDSITLWSDALKNYPGLAIAYNNRGYAFLQQGAYDRAREDFDHALLLNPGDDGTLLNRGNLSLSRGDNDRALGDYLRAAQSNPRNASAYLNAAAILAKKKDYARALALYRQALEIDPENIKANYGCGELFAATDNAREAWRYFDRAVRAVPRSAGDFNDQGAAYARKGEWEKARECFTRSLEIDGRNALVYANRGNAYAAAGDYARAIADYSRAIDIDPRYAAAYFTRAAARFYVKDYGNAQADVDRARALGYPIDPEFERMLRTAGNKRRN